MRDENKNMPQDDGIEYQPENEQKRLFKKKRAGVVLTEDEVREIQAGRKKLRQDLLDLGIKSKKDFELTASSMGLYFDKRKGGALLLFVAAIAPKPSRRKVRPAHLIPGQTTKKDD